MYRFVVCFVGAGLLDASLRVYLKKPAERGLVVSPL